MTTLSDCGEMTTATVEMLHSPPPGPLGWVFTPEGAMVREKVLTDHPIQEWRWRTVASAVAIRPPNGLEPTWVMLPNGTIRPLGDDLTLWLPESE